MLKKVLSEGRRKEMAALAQKYAVGMLIAEKRHALAKECLDAFLARFVQGEFDNGHTHTKLHAGACVVWAPVLTQ